MTHFPIWMINYIRNFSIFYILLFFLKKGPPDAVKYIFDIILFQDFFINDHIEKCSRSIGIKFVLYFFSLVLINFHPQIMDSLFALDKFFVCGITLIVGSKPWNPDIPIIV